MLRASFTAALLPIIALGCQGSTAGRIVTPEGARESIAWSDEQRAQDVAVHTLRSTDEASFHVVRLRTREQPHVHDRSDLTVLVLRGDVALHFGDRVVPAGTGDVVEIPRGEPHWAENRSSAPSLAYVIFTPVFGGKDRRPVD